MPQKSFEECCGKGERLGKGRKDQSFRFGAVQVASLLSRTSQAAASGQYELFKTSTRFDATARNPQWLG